MAKFYASLTGPLLDIYYPLPFTDDTKNRIALNTSRLKPLWCSVYSEEEVDKMIKRRKRTMKIEIKHRFSGAADLIAAGKQEHRVIDTQKATEIVS